MVDNVVSSSELLSDLSDPNVITFDDPPSSSNIEHSFHYIAVGVLLIAFAVLGLTVRQFNFPKLYDITTLNQKAAVFYFKFPGDYQRFSAHHRQLLPFLNRKNPNIADELHSNHWLYGKNSSFFEENHINLNKCQPSQKFQSNRNKTFEQTLKPHVDSLDSQQDLPLISEGRRFTVTNY